jgi:hypothetical protein
MTIVILFNLLYIIEVHMSVTQVRGLVPRLPRAADYDPKFWIRPVSFSSKRLRNHTLCTEYGSITFD